MLNAADYGSAQVRHRVILLGSRDKELRSIVFRKQTSRPMMTLDIVPPTHHRTARYGGIEPWRTLKDGIGHLAGLIVAFVVLGLVFSVAESRR